jgi:hypothetical protein
MDWLTFISKTIEALAWPAVVVVLLTLSRPFLKGLLERLEELTLPGGVGAKFGKDLAAARTIAEAESSERDASPEAKFDGAPNALPKPRIKFRDAADPFLQLARIFPEAAVLQAYQDLEQIFDENRDLIKYIDQSRQMRDPVNTIINGLRGAGLLSNGWMDLYARIRNLRNLAVHGRGEGRISPGEAMEYRALVYALIEQLKKAINAYRASKT